MAFQQKRVLFVDSADPKEIEEALRRGLQGVTTNPSLTAKQPVIKAKSPFDQYVNHMNSIAEICANHQMEDKDVPSLSVEVFSLEPEEMLDQARKIREFIPYENLAIKIPVSYDDGMVKRDYLPIIHELSLEMKINCTCCFSASQLQLASQAGAQYVSLFYNRLIDYFNALPNSRGNGQELALDELRVTRRYLDSNPKLESRIILGSIRNNYDIVNGWLNGADIVTTSLKVLPGLIYHPATDKSVKGFDEDIQKWLNR